MSTIDAYLPPAPDAEARKAMVEEIMDAHSACISAFAEAGQGNADYLGVPYEAREARLRARVEKALGVTK